MIFALPIRETYSRPELKKREMGYIWHDQRDSNGGEKYKFKGRYNAAEYHNPLTEISHNKSLIFYTHVLLRFVTLALVTVKLKIQFLL